MPPRRWEGIIAIEGQATGDGRIIDIGSLSWDGGPWPVKFDRTRGGHDGPVVGEATRIWRDGANIRAEGVLHSETADAETSADVGRLVELLESGSIGVSVSLDSETVELRVKKEVWDEWQAEMEAWLNDEVPEPEDPETDADGRIVLDRFSFDDFVEAFTAGRIREISMVDVGALSDAEAEVDETAPTEDGVAASVRLVDTVGLVASLSLDERSRAFSNPNFGESGDVDPRLVWQDPQRPEEAGGWGCPLTLEDDGRIYGHATLRNRCHGSFAACLPPPDSGGDFSRFLCGEAIPGVATGPIVLDTTHGVDDNGKVKSSDWLADTGRAVADVTVGHDRHGMWVAGMVRPGITDREMATLRGSTLSAEWHPQGAKLRLVGILAVNAPGYLVQRHGVAASFTVGARCCPGEEKTLEERVHTLEQIARDQLRRGI